MIQGGDITKGDGTGGKSIYGQDFEDENIGWREIDAPGLLCMANRGRDTNSSQFFITLAPCEHLNAKHTVFGHVISGQETLDRISKVAVDKEDRPLTDVLVSHCGELERARKRGPLDTLVQDDMKPHSRQSTTSRGRHKRRHTDSQSRSRSRSRSPSRGHTRPSASRHRHSHRHRRQRGPDGTPDAATAPSSRSPTRQERRRSDAEVDHTQRGRPRQRHRSGSPVNEDDGRMRKRSTEPSRRTSPSPGYRRQRSLPNQYEPHQERQRARDEAAEQDRMALMEWEGSGPRYDNRGARNRRREGEYQDNGRLGAYQSSGGRLGGHDDYGGQQEPVGEGIIYKGRGAMKFKEKR